MILLPLDFIDATGKEFRIIDWNKGKGEPEYWLCKRVENGSCVTVKQLSEAEVKEYARKCQESIR